MSGEPVVEKEWLSLANPLPGVTYPIAVTYCGVCGLPPEYCEYGAEFEKCKEWLESHLPEEFEKLNAGNAAVAEEGDAAEKDEKKRQKRGGKAAIKTQQKKTAGPQQIFLSKAPRGKKKMVTVVTGLSSYDIDVKVASKFLGSRFACGASVTADDEITIQGDFIDDLFDILPEKWPQIDEDSIEDLGEMKR